MTKVRSRFTELDGLRGAAALMVVVFHLRRQIRELDAPDAFTQLIGGGYMMVDLFFVLSGFVLAKTMLQVRSAREVGRFSSIRTRRFMPLHLTGWGIALLCVALTALLQHYNVQHMPDTPAFQKETTSLWGWVSSVFLLQGFFGPDFSGYPAAWSLSIELWTNILLVAMIALAPARSVRRLVAPAGLVIGALILITANPDAENTIGMTAFGRGLIGLAAGMLGYHLYLALERPDAGFGRIVRSQRWGTHWPGIGGGLGVIALLASMYWSHQVRDLQFLPMIPISLLLVLCLAQPSAGITHRVLNSGPLQWLGGRSFALYALHGSILMAVTLACRIRGLNLHDPKTLTLIIVAELVGALTAAELGHRFIERLWIPRNPRRPSTPPIRTVPIAAMPVEAMETAV
jgi:peptidoglycan/LPS O-acetylase OafA/YrhL